MATIPTVDQILKLAPQAKTQYVQCFEQAGKTLAEFGVTTPLRVAHFMAQVLHESGALSVTRESLRYLTPERLMAVWPSRFPTRESALPYVKNEAALAEKVYSGRMGNVPGSGDAFKFLGRGLIQITGRYSYEKFGKILGIDLVGNPDLAFSFPHALRLAAAEFSVSKCNEVADADNLLLVSSRINLGKDVTSTKSVVGYDERKMWLARTKKVWAP